MSGLRNCRKITRPSPVGLARGRAFGPYSSSRSDTSARLSPDGREWNSRRASSGVRVCGAPDDEARATGCSTRTGQLGGWSVALLTRDKSTSTRNPARPRARWASPLFRPGRLKAEQGKRESNKWPDDIRKRDGRKPEVVDTPPVSSQTPGREQAYAACRHSQLPVSPVRNAGYPRFGSWVGCSAL